MSEILANAPRRAGATFCGPKLLPLPLIILILSGKGGVGKTLLALLLADLCELNGIPLDIVQVDDQERLQKALGRKILSVDIALLKRARKDPRTLTSAFNPMYELIESMRNSQRSVLIDVGATQQHLLFDYASLTELHEDLVEYGIRLCAFVPLVVDPESIDQAARQIETLGRVFQSAQPILVLNERDGSFSGIAERSEAARLYRERIEPLSVPRIVMPRIEAGSWLHFERQHCRLIDVVGFDVATAMSVSGLSRPEARLARGDVAAWVASMEDALSAVLPLAKEQSANG